MFNKNIFALIFLQFFILLNMNLAQGQINLMGKVSCDNIPVEKIEIINLTSEKSAISDSDGNFAISAKAEDLLVIVSKKYEYKRVFLEQELIDKNNIIIQLIPKPIELQEVVITKFSLSNIKYDNSSFYQAYLEKVAKTPKIIGVYDGKIENGVDIIGLLVMGYNILMKPNRNIPTKKIYFQDIIKNKFKDDFFVKKLNLNPNHIGLFIEFCDADPKSKTIVENANVLSLMDFLYIKNIEFKKISDFKN